MSRKFNDCISQNELPNWASKQQQTNKIIKSSHEISILAIADFNDDEDNFLILIFTIMIIQNVNKLCSI